MLITKPLTEKKPSGVFPPTLLNIANAIRSQRELQQRTNASS